MSKVTESRRQVSEIREECDSSEVQEETDSSFIAESFICPLLDLAPPFENSCTLPSPDYTFNSIQQSPTPSEILRFTSDIRNSMSVKPSGEDDDEIDSGAKEREAESLVTLKEMEHPKKGRVFAYKNMSVLKRWLAIAIHDNVVLALPFSKCMVYT